MPLRLEIKRKLSVRSERVKCVDLHPTEPWVLAAMYEGKLAIYNYETQDTLRVFDVTNAPIRSAKFVPRKQWVVCVCDDYMFRAYNYNTMEKVKEFECHFDYPRYIEVHPTLPYLLTTSDDLSIKLWNWDKDWANTITFDGHSHYVMMARFNPKDTNTFATASIDKTVKVWGLGTKDAHFTLTGHTQGVNCIAYFSGGDKPYLASGSDDETVRIWDYQNKSCVQVLDGHSNSINDVCFHPELPIILSGSEDGTCRIWHSSTYRLETTLNYAMERLWSISALPGSNHVALAYDQGTMLIKIGREEPAVSMDANGKLIWSRHTEIFAAGLKNVDVEGTPDGERVVLPAREMGNTEVFPQSLQHNPKGNFVVVCGDGEYIIYTALAWRNKSFGNALEFVWANDNNMYAVRESSSKIKVFANFKEHNNFRPAFTAEGIFGGALLGVCSSTSLTFYDWATCKVVRKIELAPRAIHWSDDGTTCVVVAEASFYVLRYNRALIQAAYEAGAEVPEQGFPDAFEVLYEVTEKVSTGTMRGETFIFTNAADRLNYCVGGDVVTVAHLDRKMYILGYLPKENKVVLVDKAVNAAFYTIAMNVIEYQQAIVNQQLDVAADLAPTIPDNQRNRVARFLDAQGLKDLALDMSMDPEHRFDLAVQVGKLKFAYEMAKEAENEEKWKQLADLAMANSDFDLSQECLLHAEDLSGLLLLHTSRGNADGLRSLTEKAAELGRNNVAFMGHFLLHDLDACIKLLVDTDRIPEAALFARTYAPSKVPEIVDLWRGDLGKISEKAASALADPVQYPNLFDDYAWALEVEKSLISQRQQRAAKPASEYQPGSEAPLVPEDGVPTPAMSVAAESPLVPEPAEPAPAPVSPAMPVAAESPLVPEPAEPAPAPVSPAMPVAAEPPLVPEAVAPEPTPVSPTPPAAVDSPLVPEAVAPEPTPVSPAPPAAVESPLVPDPAEPVPPATAQSPLVPEAAEPEAEAAAPAPAPAVDLDDLDMDWGDASL